MVVWLRRGHSAGEPRLAMRSESRPRSREFSGKIARILCRPMAGARREENRILRAKKQGPFIKDPCFCFTDNHSLV